MSARTTCTALRVALALLLGAPAAALANGWEHTAVPLEALRAGLVYANPITRARAAESLGFRGQTEAVPALLDALARPEPYPFVRDALYAALGALRDPRARPALRECLDEEAREELRATCAAALGALGGPEDLRRLLALLASDEHLLVKSRAVDALGGFADPDAVTALARLIDGAAPDTARLWARAVRALGRTGNHAAAGPLLRALARSSSPEQRLSIVRALARIGAPEARPALGEIAATSPDPRLRAAAAVALGATDDRELRPTLERLLDDPVPAVRYAAIGALRGLGDPRAAPALARAAETLADQLAAAAPQALVEDAPRTVGEASLLEAALRALVELDPAAGLDAFGVSARARAVPRTSTAGLAVAGALYQVRRAALYGLGYTGAASAAELLAGRDGIGDPDFRLRAVAARALGVLGGADTSTRLLPLLADDAAEVRWTTAMVLGRLEDRAAVDPLIARLGDRTARVRREAALALGYLGDPRALAALRAMAASDGDADARTAAGFAVSLLSDPG